MMVEGKDNLNLKLSPPLFSIVMRNSKGERMARIYETEEGTLTFDGDKIDEAAEIFLQEVCRLFNQMHGAKYFQASPTERGET